jgi:hypothetical protein
LRKHELKRALKAAASVSGELEFFLIGSQAVHAESDRPPAEVLLSQECDLYPRTRPECAELLNRKLGRNSPFARKNGFYVDVVTPEIASLPEGWEKRVKPLRVGRITAFCLEIHDLLASKLAAGRLKDLELTGAILKQRRAKPPTLRARVQKLTSIAARKHAVSCLKLILREIKENRAKRRPSVKRS